MKKLILLLIVLASISVTLAHATNWVEFIHKTYLDIDSIYAVPDMGQYEFHIKILKGSPLFKSPDKNKDVWFEILNVKLDCVQKTAQGTDMYVYDNHANLIAMEENMPVPKFAFKEDSLFEGMCTALSSIYERDERESAL